MQRLYIIVYVILQRDIHLFEIIVKFLNHYRPTDFENNNS